MVFTGNFRLVGKCGLVLDIMVGGFLAIIFGFLDPMFWIFFNDFMAAHGNSMATQPKFLL